MREMALKAVLLIAAGALLMAGMRLAEWVIPVPERTINLNIQQEETEGPYMKPLLRGRSAIPVGRNVANPWPLLDFADEAKSSPDALYFFGGCRYTSSQGRTTTVRRHQPQKRRTDMTKITFNDNTYTEASLSDLSGPALVSLYNDLMAELHEGREDQAPRVRRFADKATAVARTWKLLQRFAEAQAKKDAGEKKKKKARRGTNLLPPGHAPIPCREGSKQAILLDMLARPNGATMEELLDALSGGKRPWTEATVRSGFGWDMKLKGYGVRSQFDADGTERFFIVVPEGHSIPPHRPLKSASKANAHQARFEV